jgi:hypothetical protein
MTAPWRILSGAAAVALGLGFATTVWAASPQDSSTGGQENKCWGQTASQLGQQSDPSVTGGGMGAHSRSETAADINGGFANSTN